ncbi:MAG: hypothetical protein BEN19_08200 [Epulopiscium sp. Nuni2H_MBin003]|nr:MAG: hypothetical protein BEN19_08200 [Epulopiscium sp. Nuni2H_MBin003]
MFKKIIALILVIVILAHAAIFITLFRIEDLSTTIISCVCIILLEIILVYLSLLLFTERIRVSINKLNRYIENLDDIPQLHIEVYKEEFEEFKKLIVSLDTMIDRYNKNTKNLRYEKRKADLILSYLEQGIIILDDLGLVKEINDFCITSLQLNIKIDDKIENLFSNSTFQKMLSTSIAQKQSKNCEITVNSQNLYIKIKPLIKNTDKYGYIMSIRDITDIRKFDEIKYQFVNNVTHELKTPLTSIKGFIETLQLGAINDKNAATRFLEIMDIEATRLYNLIEDILLLSDIEQTEVIMPEEFDLTALVTETISLLESQASKKGIPIIIKLDQINFKGEPDHFKQILINLISNSIKYTEKGHIEVLLKEKQNDIFLIVKDTGVGIAYAHQNRIFERFYRIDKSRSRQSGGTGLGLSIVKHLVATYNGDIRVNSALGKGSAFIIRFNTKKY